MRVLAIAYLLYLLDRVAIYHHLGTLRIFMFNSLSLRYGTLFVFWACSAMVLFGGRLSSWGRVEEFYIRLLWFGFLREVISIRSLLRGRKVGISLLSHFLFQIALVHYFLDSCIHIDSIVFYLDTWRLRHPPQHLGHHWVHLEYSHEALCMFQIIVLCFNLLWTFIHW